MVWKDFSFQWQGGCSAAGFHCCPRPVWLLSLLPTWPGRLQTAWCVGGMSVLGFCVCVVWSWLFNGRFKSTSIWVFPKIGIPQNGWFILENPIKMDDLGVPLFSETSIYIYIYPQTGTFADPETHPLRGFGYHRQSIRHMPERIEVWKKYE